MFYHSNQVPLTNAILSFILQSEQDVFVFLFRHGAGDSMHEKAPIISKPLPPPVQAIVKDTKTIITSGVSITLVVIKHVALISHQWHIIEALYCFLLKKSTYIHISQLEQSFYKPPEVNKNESNVWIYFVYIVLNIVFFPLSWISCFRVNCNKTVPRNLFATGSVKFLLIHKIPLPLCV